MACQDDGPAACSTCTRCPPMSHIPAALHRFMGALHRPCPRCSLTRLKAASRGVRHASPRERCKAKQAEGRLVDPWTTTQITTMRVFSLPTELSSKICKSQRRRRGYPGCFGRMSPVCASCKGCQLVASVSGESKRIGRIAFLK